MQGAADMQSVSAAWLSMFLTGMLLSSMEVCNLLLLSLPGLSDHFSPERAEAEAVSKQAQHQFIQSEGFEPSTMQEASDCNNRVGIQHLAAEQQSLTHMV